MCLLILSIDFALTLSTSPPPVPPFLFLSLPLSQQLNPTWYLLVELKGISATLGFLSLIFLTEPQDSSMHLSRADSEASPAVSRCQEGRELSVTVGGESRGRMRSTEAPGSHRV